MAAFYAYDVYYLLVVYAVILVPVFPEMPSLAFSSSVISAVLPGFEAANFMQACTFGSMEPGANSPSSQ